MTDTDLLSYRDLFIESAEEHVQKINSELTNSSARKEVIDEIYRRIHSLKGSSSIMGFSEISQLCTKAGDLLQDREKESTRDDNLKIVQEIVNNIQQKIEEIKK